MNGTEPILIPLPNDRFDGSIVIASLWLRDDGPVVAVLVLLDPSPPYYRVVDIKWEHDKWVRQGGTQEAFPNIVPTVEHYQQCGGDY
jgi:hypothetical protein